VVFASIQLLLSWFGTLSKRGKKKQCANYGLKEYRLNNFILNIIIGDLRRRIAGVAFDLDVSHPSLTCKLLTIPIPKAMMLNGASGLRVHRRLAAEFGKIRMNI
jgi:hypothetical protein